MCYLSSLYVHHYDPNNLDAFRMKVWCILKDVSSMYEIDKKQPTIVKLQDKIFLKTCLSEARGDACGLFVLLKQKTQQTVLCARCFSNQSEAKETSSLSQGRIGTNPIISLITWLSEEKSTDYEKENKKSATK